VEPKQEVPETEDEEHRLQEAFLSKSLPAPQTPELPDFSENDSNAPVTKTEDTGPAAPAKPDDSRDVQTEPVGEPTETAAMMDGDPEDESNAVDSNSLKVVIDTGATSSMMLIEAAECLAYACTAVAPQVRKRYSFANASVATSSSAATFSTKIGSVIFDIIEPEPGAGPKRLTILLGQSVLSKSVISGPEQSLSLGGKEVKLSKATNNHLYIPAEDFFLSAANTVG
jgi:hypothetical protein